MGCASSKVDDSLVVSLCRERNQFIEKAIRQRYAFAAAHVSYIHSLKTIGDSLQRFFDEGGSVFVSSSSPAPSSPVLPLPVQRKADPVVFSPIKSHHPPPSPPHHLYPHSHSHSHSGSHLHFHSDSDNESLSNNSSPLHEGLVSSSTPPRMMTHYMRSRAAPSVSYEQKPQSPETVRWGAESYPSYPSAYPSNPSAYASNYGVSSFFGLPAFSSYSSSPPAPNSYSTAAPSTSSYATNERPRPPPPPPSPPRASSWDFLNPFDSTETFYPAYTPKRFSSHSDGASRDSKEVREEEGIPDLEDEFHHEVVKEVHVDQQFVDGSNDPTMAYYSKAGRIHPTADSQFYGDDAGGMSREAPYEARSSGVPGRVPENYGENRGVDFGVNRVDKTVIANGEQSEQNNVAALSGRGSSSALLVMKEQFDRASESGNEVSKLLEAGKLWFHQRKKAVYRVPASMLDVITPLPESSLPSTSKSAEPASSSVEKIGSVEDEAIFKGLSTILDQLYVWEKKLYEEVKAEEKMRIVHDRKCKRLKQLGDRGAESHKIDATQSMIRDLSTNLRIAIQVVNSISTKINKLRDEELWPKISELIQGLIRMWKVMLECHQNQCRVITEGRNMDLVGSGKKASEGHIQATVKLELELGNWLLNFTNWVTAQKEYVKALNGWLLNFLDQKQEETPDGIVPFSPGRIGAPPVFVICNHWSQAIEMISEREVVEAIGKFVLRVRELREQHTAQQRQRLTMEKDMERKLKALEKDEQKRNKALDVLNKKLVLLSGQSGLSLAEPMMHSTSTGNLQMGLNQIFEALSKFTASCLSAYEEVGDRMVQENTRVT